MTRVQFGRRLREHREEQRITLEAIASSTKIKSSLLAGLERGDIAEWPAGIFQRAFLRAYACAIGLPPEPVVAEFLRVFSDSAEASGENPPGAELRLTLAGDADDSAPVSSQVVTAFGEAAGLAVLAAVVSWIAATGFGAMCGAFAFLYYPVATAWLGCTPATWCLKRDTLVRTLVGGGRGSVAATAERRDRLYLVKPSAEPDHPAAAEDPATLDSESLPRRSAMR